MAGQSNPHIDVRAGKYVALCWMVERGGRKVLPHPEVLIFLNSLLDIINSMRVST
jgi:hypothetical protein